MSFDTVDRRFRTPQIKLECMRCGATDGVEKENSRTMYHFEGEQGSDDDPNRPVLLCRPCAAEHHAYWDDMWADYYSGRL